MRHPAQFILRLSGDPGPGYLSDSSINEGRWLERTYAPKRTAGQKCVHPNLNPFDPTVMQFFKKEGPVDCSSAMEDWVYVTNGTFYLSKRARRLYGKITCEYAPIVRGDDFSARHGPHVKPMPDGTALKSDFFKVACVSASGRKYLNIHSGVARNEEVLKRLDSYVEKPFTLSPSQTISSSDVLPSSSTRVEASKQFEDKEDAVEKSASSLSSNFSENSSQRHKVYESQVGQNLNLSVFMFGFDSLSRMAWIRLLPKTREYLLQTLGGIELEGYNIVGDGTPAALLPILTGHMEEELPEARRGYSGAKPVDDHPWVWKDFKRHGYVTAHGEDMALIGTFQYRMLGFKQQPTDHNMRTFYLAAERMYKNNIPLCLGSRPRHLNFINWFKDLFSVYRSYRKFFFGFHSEMSHDYNNKVQALDDDLVRLLKDLEDGGHLNSTLLILMADHGARYSYIRATTQGKLEERMPYFAFRFPPWFRKQYPQVVKNLEINSQRLTTPFDIHATLHDLLSYSGPGMADLSQRGVSLFREIPKERTCSDAGITPHWCACLEWQNVNQSNSRVRTAIQSAINTINSYTEKNRNSCAELHLSEITRSARYTPNANDLSAEQKMKKYQDSNQATYSSSEDTPSPTPSSRKELYQVSFITKPGGGHFEVTCTLDITSGAFDFSRKDISRINKYGSAPACIQDSLPHLRPYCYCV